MSTGLECAFIETEEGKWYYILQDGDCPRVVWDWREFATAYGPFESLDGALKHLRDNHANPGGHSVSPWSPEHVVDGVEAALIESAKL